MHYIPIMYPLYTHYIPIMKQIQGHTDSKCVISFGIKAQFTTHPRFISDDTLLPDDINIIGLNIEPI